MSFHNNTSKTIESAHATHPQPIRTSLDVSRPQSTSRNEGGRTPGSPSSLVGSYLTSLLERRMSSAPSPPVTFSIQLGVFGLPPCPSSLRRPPQVCIEFPASWYELSGPYVGTADIGRAQPVNAEASSMPRLGYRIPPKGQVQIVIKNPLGTPLKLLMAPYDLLDMPAGSKTLLRFRYVTQLSGADKTREVIRYAVHLSFVSPPATGTTTPKAATVPSAVDTGVFDMELDPPATEPAPKPRIYITGSIRLVFPSRTPDNDETLRCVKDELGEGSLRFTPWAPSRSGIATPVTESTRNTSERRSHNKRKSLLGGESYSFDG